MCKNQLQFTITVFYAPHLTERTKSGRVMKPYISLTTLLQCNAAIGGDFYLSTYLTSIHTSLSIARLFIMNCKIH